MNRTRATSGLLAGLLAGSLGLTACSSNGGGGDSGGKVTITLAGPNQWTSSGSSFGAPWEKLVAAFEAKEPKIRVKTTVLPVSTFASTLSTQLSAGTAPELVFAKVPVQSYMVAPLDDALAKPNPYVPGNKRWSDVFDPTVFGSKVAAAVNSDGHLYYVPFTLYASGLYYNAKLLKAAGVSYPIRTFSDFLAGCDKIKATGHTPVAMDTADFGAQEVWTVIAEMMLHRYYDRMNKFNAAGKPGTSTPVAPKSWAMAVAKGTISTSTPEVAAGLRLMKQFYDRCATPRWSGIASSSGALVGPDEFTSGKAAMAIGTSYAGDLLSTVGFSHGAMGFPTITTASTPLSQNAPARFGPSIGSSYMIPSTVKGAKYDAALKFLQYLSAPNELKPWVSATGSVPAMRGLSIPASSKGLVAGDWGKQLLVTGGPKPPAGSTFVGMFDGYLLGAKNLKQQQSYLQGLWKKSYAELAQKSGWKEPWVKQLS